MILEDEQKRLLAQFVEAHRSAPPEARGDFIASETMGDPQASFVHSRVQRLGFKGSRADAEVLADAGLLRMSWGSRGTPKFYVLPAGIAFYEDMMSATPPLQSVETDMTGHLADPSFKKVHGVAYDKWEQAARLLRSADSGAQLTTIGHLCREAQQAFAESLAAHAKVDVSNIEPAKTVARLRAVIGAKRAALGNTETPLLEAMVVYWGTLADLVQRQEHGAQREGDPLVWEDGRRVVFQTCVVMYELDRALR
jgi:hypothetical protein